MAAHRSVGAGLAAGGQARYTNAQSDDAGGTSEREGDEQRAEDERCEQGVPLPASAPGHAPALVTTREPTSGASTNPPPPRELKNPTCSVWRYTKNSGSAGMSRRF